MNWQARLSFAGSETWKVLDADTGEAITWGHSEERAKLIAATPQCREQLAHARTLLRSLVEAIPGELPNLKVQARAYLAELETSE